MDARTCVTGCVEDLMSVWPDGRRERAEMLCSFISMANGTIEIPDAYDMRQIFSREEWFEDDPDAITLREYFRLFIITTGFVLGWALYGATCVRRAARAMYVLVELPNGDRALGVSLKP